MAFCDKQPPQISHPHLIGYSIQSHIPLNISYSSQPINQPRPAQQSIMDILCQLLRQSTWPNAEERFAFPTSLQFGMTFPTIQQVVALLTQEAAKKGVKFNNLHYAFFKWKAESNQSVRIRCRICPAEINLLNRDGQLVVGHISNLHVHGPEQAYAMRRKLAKQRVKELGVFHGKRPKKYSMRKKKPFWWGIRKADELPTQQPIKPPRVAKQPQFHLLEEWMEAHCYELSYDWCEEQAMGYPPVMVVVSPYMNDSYEAYGDILNFQPVRGLHYSADSRVVAALTVNDPHDQVLFVGLAIFREDVAAATKCLRMFLSLHQNSKPLTICTSDDPIATEAVSQLIKQKMFTGLHLVSATHVMKSLQKKLKGDLQQITRSLLSLSQAMSTRDIYVFNSTLKQLEQCDISRQAVGQLLHSAASTAFYCKTADGFVGLSGGRALEISEMVLTDILKEKVNMIPFMVKFHSQSLYYKPRHAPYLLDDCQELLSSIPELDTLNKLYSKAAVTRFIQNYLKAVMEFEAVSGYNCKEVCSTKHKGRLYKVRKEMCECQQLQKTGVACPHLIAVMLQKKSKLSHKKLISLRWSINPPTIPDDPPNDQQQIKGQSISSTYNRNVRQPNSSFRTLIDMLVNHADNSWDRIIQQLQLPAENLQLKKAFVILLQKLQNIKVGNHTITKYIMRRAFVLLEEKLKRENPNREVGVVLSHYINGPENDDQFIMPQRVGASDKYFDTNFLKKVFSSQLFFDHYMKFLKCFRKILDEENEKRKKDLSEIVEECLAQGNLQKLESIQRLLPWTPKTIERIQKLAEKLAQHSPFHPQQVGQSTQFQRTNQKIRRQRKK